MLRIYTDGSCLNNPGPGGWAFATSKTEFMSGHVLKTTNQRMELTAVLAALRVYAGQGHITIISDSTYVVVCMNNRYYNKWTSDGIKKKTGEEVANWDLWQEIIHRYQDNLHLGIFFEKVVAHSGDEMNDFVDQLAKNEAREAKRYKE